MKIHDLCRDWGIPMNKIEGGVGELSDGYHTFNELYDQRLILSAALFNTYTDVAWKSRRHSDGGLCFGGGWFIVGIDTPNGPYTYHYELKDWDLFKVPELEMGKSFDGHSCKDVDRLLSIVNDKSLGSSLDEESSMLTWAKNEIKLACNLEEEDSSMDSDEFDYGKECYMSAYRAFKSLCSDGHSGMSIGFTKSILNSLIDGRPLTPIEDTDDIWTGICDTESEPKAFRCGRMSSLFKYVYSDGTIKYTDVGSYCCVDVESGSTYTSWLGRRLVDEMYPVKMPYYPSSKKIRIYCSELLTDHANGDFDTVAMHYLIDTQDNSVDINRYYKEGEPDWIQISKEEYDERSKMAEELKAADAKITNTIIE